MENEPILEFKSVCYHKGDKKILDQVSWKILRGEHWVIIGPTGAGKTTLLKAACGYIWPNGGGKIFRLGRELLDLGLLRKSIGWVTTSLLEQISPRENILRVVISGKYAQTRLRELSYDPPTDEDYLRAESYLQELGCEKQVDSQFGFLSQGEKQKVLIARARMAKPLLIILDDPCSGMDICLRENFLKSVQKTALKRNTPTFLYVTHHIEEIMPVFEKTLMIKDGKILKMGKTKDIITPETIKLLYGLKVDLVKKNGRFWIIS
jgi:iron complex transport system ATP-binding protein